ncbi:MAG: Gx transporter family protein [Treponema sp.]|jgi:uncharacterized membrane protein|nr:Gx transporter family protein [Treponema sp.]
MRFPGSDTAGEAPTDIGLLGGLSLFLSAIDYLVPKPLPFMRIGLANLPLLVALWPVRAEPLSAGPLAAQKQKTLFSLREYCLLAVVKLLGQALITGSLFSYVFIFSLAGTTGSAALMYALGSLRASRNIPVSLAGIGIAGAFASNAAQIVLARFLLLGESARFLAPPFLAAGIISGMLLGLFAEAFGKQSAWIKSRIQLTGQKTRVDKVSAPGPGGGAKELVRIFFTLALMLFFLLVSSLAVKALLFAIFFFAALVYKKRVRVLFTIAALVLVTAVNLFPPFGKIIWEAGPFVLAEGSLRSGILKALTLQGLFMLSALMASPSLIPGILGILGVLGVYLGDSFAVLSRFNGRIKPDPAHRQKLSVHGLIQWLDTMLCQK